MQEIEVLPASPGRFDALLEPAAYDRYMDALRRGAETLRARTLWHLNSTAQGGGVAEMLQSLLAYFAGADITTRWVVIDGDEAFFDLTKRIHNLLHGEPDDPNVLGDEERRLYETSLSDDLSELVGPVERGDVVVLHDPQTIGLAPALKETGAHVIWSCHVGVDEPNELARKAWRYLMPYVTATDAQVFSRRAYVWPGCAPTAWR
jgi:trehalose synthase